MVDSEGITWDIANPVTTLSYRHWGWVLDLCTADAVFVMSLFFPLPPLVLIILMLQRIHQFPCLSINERNLVFGLLFWILQSSLDFFADWTEVPGFDTSLLIFWSHLGFLFPVMTVTKSSKMLIKRGFNISLSAFSITFELCVKY